MEKQVYLLKKNVRKKDNFRKKRVKEEGRSYFRSPQKYECHSHIAPFDKKEWHSSFAPDFGSGAQKSAALEHIDERLLFRLRTATVAS